MFDWLLSILTNAILSLVSGYPIVASIIFVIGSLRFIVKPIMKAVDDIVLATPSPDDDSLWAKIKTSTWFKALLWIIDYASSIKIKTA